MGKKILNIPTDTISDLKRTNMNVFRIASKEDEGVYILKRNKIAGVVLTQKQYERLVKENDYLNGKVVELRAEVRLIEKNASVFSDREVRVKL